MMSLSDYRWSRGAIAYDSVQKIFFVVHARKQSKEGVLFLHDGQSNHAEETCIPATLGMLLGQQPSILQCGSTQLAVERWEQGLCLKTNGQTVQVRIPAIAGATGINETIERFANFFHGAIANVQEESHGHKQWR